MGKIKNSDVSMNDTNTSMNSMNGDNDEISYEDKLKFCSVIAQPMGSKKACGRVYKLVKKASKHKKKHFHNGLKDIQRQIRRGGRGIVVLAGDVSPIDMICHIPGLCEEKEIPYLYTPSKHDLGVAAGARQSIAVLIKENNEYQEYYDKVLQDIKKYEE